jgi:hypothetical protein
MSTLEIEVFPLHSPSDKITLPRGANAFAMDFSDGYYFSWGGKCAFDGSGGEVDVAVDMPLTKKVFSVAKDSAIVVKQGERVILKVTHRSSNP